MALRQRASRLRVLVGHGSAIANNPSDTLCRRVSAFRPRLRQDRLCLLRVNGEGFPDPRRLPSTSASLIRAACAATSANPPATSLRLSHRTSASGALFSPLPPAFAFGSGRRPSPFVRRGLPVPLHVQTFRCGRAVGGWSVARRLLQSLCPIREHDRRIVRSPPTRYRVSMSFFCGLAVVESRRPLARSPLLAKRPKPPHELSIQSPGCYRHVRGRPRFRVDQLNRFGPGAFAPDRRNSIATPTVAFASTSRRRARGECRIGVSDPGRRCWVVVKPTPETGDPFFRHANRLRSSLPAPLNVLARLQRLFRALEP